MPEKAMRTQVDGLDEVYSYETSLDCSDLPDLARQEFKDETDVNKVLARYGVNTPMRTPEYTIVDYDTDLQQSLDAIRSAQAAIAKLPPDLQRKYPGWDYLMEGLVTGQFKKDFDAEKAKEKAALDKAAEPVADSPPTQDPRD